MAMTGNPATHSMRRVSALRDPDTEIGAVIHDKYGLPALEVSDEVFESPASAVFEQAETLLHTNEVIMVATLCHSDAGPR
jgi:ornithine carbamoyltransferase